MKNSRAVGRLKDVWENTFSSQEWGKYPAEPLIRFVARNFYNKQRDQIHIMEIGCGPGPNIWYFAREGFRVYGIDISENAIRRATNRMREEGLKAELSVGDIEKLPFKDGSFDCVVDNECLYCSSRRVTESILAELVRVTKRKGFFFSRTFTDDMYTGRMHKRLGDMEFDEVSDGVFAGKGLTRLIDKSGIEELYGKYFEILTIDKMECTYNNGTARISEWIIVSRKE